MVTVNTKTEGVSGLIKAFRVDPRIIQVDPSYNLRDYDTAEAKESHEDMIRSVLENGIRVPLMVKIGANGSMVLKQGHRRLRAVLSIIERGLGDMKSVPVVEDYMAGKLSTPADDTLDLILSNSGEGYTILEKARVVQRLKGVFGWTMKDISKKWGVSEVTLGKWVEVLGLPEAVQTQIKEGSIRETTALQVVKELGAENAAEEIANAITEKVEANTKAGKDSSTLVTVSAADVSATAKGMKKADGRGRPPKEASEAKEVSKATPNTVEGRKQKRLKDLSDKAVLEMIESLAFVARFDVAKVDKAHAINMVNQANETFKKFKVDPNDF